MTEPPTPVRSVANKRTTETDARTRSETMLVSRAKRWIGEALDAWGEDDQGKVTLMAPLAVELLGKATLWRENPVLLVPLTDSNEDTLFKLATSPDLATKGLKTIGLRAVMDRLNRVVGELPVVLPRRKRLIDVRNGAVHVGAGEESRYVLLDCLAIVEVLLRRLDAERKDFFGPHLDTVSMLLGQRTSQISHQVAVKITKAKTRLARLEEALGREPFEKATDELEKQRWTLDADDLVSGGEGVEIDCPACGFKARLFGLVDLNAEMDYDVEPMGGGVYESVEMPYWQVTLSPQAFRCTVCNLRLQGTEELARAGLHFRPFDVSDDELGPDFDLYAYIEAMHPDED